jgi:chemotaxis protein methyltransferase CheR
MTPDDITLLVSLCRVRAGLKVAPEKTYLIESRLNPLARRERYASISDMLAAVRERREDALLWAIVEAMAAGESAFFTDRATFEILRTQILPALSRARGGRPLRIWSAACGAGQEVYSMAMLGEALAESGVQIELAASDLSERMLEKAQSGLYTQFEVQRGLPIRQLAAYFEKEDDLWRIAPHIRQMVRWRRINLIAGLKGLGPFDVILCRNVLSAMVEPAREKVLAELAASLAPDGVLVTGLREQIEPGPAFLPLPRAPGMFTRNPAHRAAAALTGRAETSA